MSPVLSQALRSLGLLCLLPAGVQVLAQAPGGWNRDLALGSDLPAGTSWYGAGLWGGGSQGGPAPLVTSLGLGNATTGWGPTLEGGVNLDRWSLAAKVIGNGDPDNPSRAALYQWHLTHTSPGGWKVSLEAEPLVWGYGNLGGYLLGESARPVPKLLVASPYRQVALGSWSLGQWGFQWFTGRLEQDRGTPPLSQMPLLATTMAASAGGQIESPFLSGYRVQSRSLDGKIEFYLGWTVLWGGTLNGVPVTRGYSLGDYLVAITGTKDPLAESSIDFSGPTPTSVPYVNKGRSSTNFDTGMRFQADWLARLTTSDKAWFYVSRGSKGVLLQWGVLARKPLYYLQQDVQSTLKAAARGSVSGIWNKKDSYVLPNLIVPNDTIGMLFQWSKVRLGLEHHDTSNPAGVSYRSFVSNTYPAGFYTRGDALGEALGGEANTTDLRVEVDVTPHLTSTSWVLGGLRYFREDLALWSAAHPGAAPVTDRFTGAQEALTWKLTPTATLETGASWQRHSALSYLPDNLSNGFRWYSSLGFRFATHR